MKLLCISGSPRGKSSNTLRLVEEAIAGATETEPDISVEQIHLGDLQIKFCTGCGACHRKLLACPVKDDIGEVLEKMLNADTIILASPVYINQVTAQLKVLLDRSSPFVHCQMLRGKYGAAFATSGGGPHEMVPEYLKEYLVSCGAQYVCGVSASMSSIQEASKKAWALSEKLARAVKEQKTYPDQLALMEKRKAFFKPVISSRKDEWKGEHDYWQQKGWL
ncbi:MAG: hypothetical protein PWR02_1596 [Synergistales bacterium]|jgi:multimeric flavodoxin WrbA|nr:hypothetical protein [Synergistales bacterium]